MALCKGFQYEKYPIGTFIFKKGEISNNKFYVILSGKVAIVVPKKVPIPAQRRSRILLDPTPTPIQKPPMKRDLSLKILTTKNRQKLGHHMERSVGRSPKVGSETPVEERKGNKPVLRREKTMWGPFSLLYSKDDSQEKGILSERKEVDSLLLKEIPQTKVVVSKEVEEELDLTDEQKFQEYTAKFGKIVRFMETGESFGDLALKDNIPRQATVVCNTDCELLVISKHQFEIIFLAKEREKEEFLRSIFPFLKTLSTINFNNILYSFQVRLFKREYFLLIKID